MHFAGLVPSQNLRILHHPDIDHFRQGLRGASVDFVPLANVVGPIGQAVLSLPGCELYLLHTFPRIVQAMLESSSAFVILSMKDRPSVIFNGREAEPSSLQFARGRAEYRAVERERGYFAALGFSPAVENCGWPEIHGEFRTIPIPRDLELSLRGTILRVFAAASQDANLTMIPEAATGLVDSVLEVLDRIFDNYLCLKFSRRELVHDSLRALRTVDELLDFEFVEADLQRGDRLKAWGFGSDPEQSDGPGPWNELAPLHPRPALVEGSATTLGRRTAPDQGNRADQRLLASR